MFFVYIAHHVYYYSFGAYQAFRRKFTMHRRSQAGTIVSFDKKELDQPVQESFSIWTTNETFQYKLVHKYESYRPQCVYVMAHSTTEPASKFRSDRFSKASEENICKFISNETLIPLSDVPPEYNKLAIAFKECL